MCVGYFREILPEDILLPEAGRNVATKIGARYYETSVLEEFGLEHVFMNVMRAALVGRRSRHFYLAVGPLKNVEPPELQEPHLVPRPTMPTVLRSQLAVNADFSSLIGNSAFVYVVFDIHGVLIGAHAACLAISSAVFCDLLSIVVLGQDASSTIKCCSNGKDKDVNGADHIETPPCHNCVHLDHPVFKSFICPILTSDGLLVPAKVTVSDTVSLLAFRVVLHFVYAGTLPPLLAHWCPDVYHLAEMLDMPSLVQAVANISTDQDFLNVEIHRDICKERCSRIRCSLLQDGLFSGMCLDYTIVTTTVLRPLYGSASVHRHTGEELKDLLEQSFTANGNY